MTRARAAGRLRALALGILLLTVAPAALARASEDPRFFGAYCGTATFVVRVRVLLFGFIPVGEREVEVPATFRVTVAHELSPRGAGVLTGSGTAVARGREHAFAFSGLVIDHGRAIVKGSSGRSLNAQGEAVLSFDGDILVVRALGYAVSLSKAACGNRRPVASISAPAASALPWGQMVRFSGQGFDPEDGIIPGERLEWRSSRDGYLGRGKTLERHFLSPGEHLITLTATDSGGRLGSFARRLTITNNPPTVSIDAPSARVFYVGQTIGFRGSAFDRESGNLTGEALRWTSSGNGYLGAGRDITTHLSEGSQVVTLTATDHKGDSASASIRLDVRPRPATNTPPTVVVSSPSPPIAIADTDCLTLVANASDLEDGSLDGEALVWRDRYVNASGAAVTRELTDHGAAIEVCGFATGRGDTAHQLEVTATDREGESATDSVRVLVIPGGLF